MGYELLENVFALYICIKMPNITPEQAFELLEAGVLPERTDITEQDVKAMVKLREQGMKYKDIGDRYNLSMDAARRRIIRYQQRTGRGYSDEATKPDPDS